MKEYLKMGHKESVKTTGQGKYYLPIKQSSGLEA